MKYQYWLMKLSGIGNENKKLLIQTYKSAEAIYHLSKEEWRKVTILEEKKKQILLKSKENWDLEAEYLNFAKSGQGLITIENPHYFKQMEHLFNPPYGLYYIGELPEVTQEVIAIVGARNCSEYGKKMAYEMAYELGRRGYIVISGMAKGIDRFAHEGCLNAGGKTIAVLGSGADVCYPRENAKIYERIKTQGCILSEYDPGVPPIAKQFPARNRIISGIASRVVVVEARKKSGSLITMDYALEQGKDIYAVPGRITDELSRGCNALIAQGAGMITSIADFLSNIEEIDSTELGVAYLGKENQILLEKEELLVYSCFDFYPKSLEQVLGESGFDLLTLLSLVMNLCDKGYLKEVFKNEYIKIN